MKYIRLYLWGLLLLCICSAATGVFCRDCRTYHSPEFECAYDPDDSGMFSMPISLEPDSFLNSTWFNEVAQQFGQLVVEGGLLERTFRSDEQEDRQAFRTFVMKYILGNITEAGCTTLALNTISSKDKAVKIIGKQYSDHLCESKEHHDSIVVMEELAVKKRKMKTQQLGKNIQKME